MPLELKLVHKLIYKLKLTPRMRLGIHLLQMPLLKLKEHIEQQIEENPLLERENAAPRSAGDEEKRNYTESLITKPLTLQEHLVRQLHLLAESGEDRRIGEEIVGDIDDNGYLNCSIEDVARSTESTPLKASKVLSLIQTFDPVGVGAMDLRECLLLQLRAKGDNKSLAYKIVDKFLPYLKNKRYKYIAQKLKVRLEKIKEAIKEIARLEPKPGCSFNPERTVRLIPDAILRKEEKRYEVVFNDWELPRLVINDKYKRMIKQKDTPKDAKEYLRERLGAARLLIDAISRRRETTQKVIEEIVHVQKDFLDNGVAGFKPMTLEQIAERIGKHKSTISRAMTNKYLETPHGIVELRYFLNPGVRQENGELHSSRAIKARIRGLIEKRDGETPLTDRKIALSLKEGGISVSRRTIAKYRAQLKILPSRSRQK
ncbi:MAG: RNA polymerase factor sigma-54 [Candidatus Omnitrophica bacterium]|nr:RNA polymerase factor sigma-54 [Candidatus Omnitrophota bacterium]